MYICSVVNQRVCCVDLYQYIEKTFIRCWIKESFTAPWIVIGKIQLILVTVNQVSTSFISHHTKDHCISYFSGAVIKCNDQSNLQKKEFIQVYSERGKGGSQQVWGKYRKLRYKESTEKANCKGQDHLNSQSSLQVTYIFL